MNVVLFVVVLDGTPDYLGVLGPYLTQAIFFFVLTFPVGLYFTLTEASKRSASIGKRKTGLKVQCINGQSIGLGQSALPQVAKEDISYRIIGYRADGKRLKVYISGWKDHVALYPAPKNEELLEKLKPYIHGRGTVKFSASASLPTELIRETVKSLVEK